MACFRKIILIAIALLVLQFGCLIAAVRDLQPFPQQVQILGESPLKLSASLRIAVADYDSPPRWKSQKVPAWLLLQSELVSLFQKAGIPSPSFLDPASPDSETAELWIEIGEDTFVSDVMKRRGIIAGDSHETLEEYRISMEHYRIRIDATDILAAHWAVLTLMDLMRLESDSLYVNRVSVRDWPDFPVRVATINGSMRNETQIASANRIADLAYYSKFNEIEWNSNDAGRKDDKQSSLAASLALCKKIERRAQRLSMSVDRTGYTVEQPEWQEAIPVIGTPLIAADSALLLDMESKQVEMLNSSFEIVSDDRSTVPSWSPSTRNSAEWIKLDTLKAKSGRYSLLFEADTLLRSGGLYQIIEVEPFQYLNLKLWYQAVDFQGMLWVRAQEANTREPIDALMQVKRLDNTDEWTAVDLRFSTFGMNRIRLIIGISKMRSGQVWLDDLEITHAFPENIIRRPDTPLHLFLEPAHELLEEGADYSVMETYSTAYDHFVRSPEFRIAENDRLKAGDKLELNWGCGVKFQQHRETVCFSLREPLAEYTDRLRTVKQFLRPDAYNIHIDEVSYSGYDSLCRSSGKSPAQLVGEYCHAMYDSIRIVKPASHVRIYGDPFDIFVHDVRAHPVKYRPWTAGEHGQSSLSFLPRDIQIMAMPNYSQNFDSSFTFFERLGFKAVVALMLDIDISQSDKHMLTGRRHDNCVGLQVYGWYENSFEVLPGLSYLAWNMKPAMIAYPPLVGDSSITFRVDAWSHSLNDDSSTLIDSVIFQYSTADSADLQSINMTSAGANRYSCLLKLAGDSNDAISYRFLAFDRRELRSASPPPEFAPYAFRVTPE